MPIFQVRKRLDCPSREWSVVPMDGGHVRHSKLHVCDVHEEATVTEGRVRRNYKKKNCWETTRRRRGPHHKATRQSTPEDRRKGDILNQDFEQWERLEFQKKRFHSIFFLSLGRNTLDHGRLHLAQNSVAANYAFGFPAAHLQLFWRNLCSTSYALIYYACWWPFHYIPLPKKENHCTFKCFSRLGLSQWPL